MLGKPSCRVADGSWQQCAASDDEAAPAAPAGDASPSVPTTLSGETCILPAVSEMTTVECVACGAVRLTHVSLPLSLPDCQVYRGEVVNECIPIAGKASCRVADGSWQPCAGGDVAAGGATPVGSEVGEMPTAGSALSAGGQLCVFPAVSPPPLSRPQHEGRD